MSVLRALLILPPVAAGIALVAIAAANRPAPAQTTAQERTVAARYVTVEPTAFLPRVVGYGTVAPARTWTAVAQVGGRLEEVAPGFVRGAFLDAGALVARIAPDDFALAIAQAEANIGATDANIAELTATAEATARSLEIERQALDLEIQDLERQRTLLGRGSASAATVDQKQGEVLRQRAKIQDLENSLALVPSKRRALEQQKALNEANRRIADLNLERTEIRTPFAGRVAATNVESTQFVGVGTVLGTLDGTGAAEVDVQVPQTDMRDFGRLVSLGAAGPGGPGGGMAAAVRDVGGRLDLPATVRLRVGDGGIEWPGRVTRVSDTVDPKTRTIGMIVTVDDPYGGVLPGERPPLIKGMFVEVEVRGRPVEGALVVPRAAVTDGQVHVVGADDRLEARKVRVAYTFRDAAVVAEGLAPGDRVVVSELAPALPGQRLNAVPDEDRAQRLQAVAAGGTPR